MLDVVSIKKFFPIFANQKQLVYLDNASTTHKPRAVLDAMDFYYTHINSNIHRGIYKISEQATELYEKSRAKVAEFVHARDVCEIIFTKGTTEALNLVAYSWGEHNIGEGDEIAVTYLEHHANFIPWQQLARRKKAVLKLIPLSERALVSAEAVRATLSTKTKLVAVTHVSNVLGVITPLAEIVALAHTVGAKVVVDAAQSIAHLPVDVQTLDCDFLAFSGHKMYGPTGVGVLYGKKALLEAMPPFLFGGGMISDVTVETTTFAELPAKFEGGTPPIAQVIGLAKALDFLRECGLDAIREHERALIAYAFDRMSSEFADITIYGPRDATLVTGAISFNISDIHAHDVATLVDEKGIAIRVGHHCAQPLMKKLGVPATCRVSFGVYNRQSDIDALIEGLRYAQSVFQ